MITKALTKAINLPCWKGAVYPQPLTGGITNINFVIEDEGEKYVVRIADDIILHQVMRFNELAASKAACSAGISPDVTYSEPGVLVIQFIEGKTLAAKDIQKREMLERILPVLQACHRDVKKHIRGPALAFWVFHVVNDYALTLKDAKSRMVDQLPALLTAAENLEKAVGMIEIIWGHNDLLPANFIDDGEKVWLIDWDYAGFNSPLFDLGGLASNCQLTTADEEWLLENYYDKTVTDLLRYRYFAMKCASLLRESMWSMVSEIYSNIDFDFKEYTDTNLAAFMKQYKIFLSM
ncbi:MAG: choline kinase [Desulfobulbaceae bacterium S3730MH12]|nr:MAG: choline kinase [Desulfobulbaceae bacterium S3730MH12]OEU82626.1 MAG: choline kinase [Desulfobulbaceae bacterium C00003063]